MKNFVYSVEIRDKEGKRYRTDRNTTVDDFTFEEKEENESIINLICQRTFEEYKAICKEGSDISIEVRVFNSFTETYMLLYSFYGAKNKFIKH